jgi:sulfate transporter 3
MDKYMKQEGIAVGRTFAAIRNYKVDGNKEMIAIGFMNVVGSTTSCYVTTGSPFYAKNK